MTTPAILAVVVVVAALAWHAGRRALRGPTSSRAARFLDGTGGRVVGAALLVVVAALAVLVVRVAVAVALQSE